MAKRRSSASRSSVIPALAAVGIGAGVYLLARRSASATTMPEIPTPTTPSTPRGPAPTGTSSSVGTTPALIARLTASGPNGAYARQVFYVQSMLYSYSYVDDFPDGLLGPVTWANINSLRAQTGLPQDTTWSVQTIVDVIRAIQMQAGGPRNARILPFPLPSGIIDSINANVVPIAGPGAPMLQAYAV